MRKRFEVFAALAAAAILFRWEAGIYFQAPGSTNVVSTGWISVLLAFGVLANPSELRWLLAMYSGVLIDVFRIAPAVPNHYVLTACVGLSLWVVTLAMTARDRRVPEGHELIGAFGFPFAVGVAVFYLFTGIWKSNSGFADLQYSCGALSWLRLRDQFTFLPDGPAVRTAVIAFTLVLEYAGPVLLLVPRTRWATATFFVFFHCVLALDVKQNYQNFSWTMMPLLSLYLPDDAWDRAVAAVPNLDGVTNFGRRSVITGHAALLVVAYFSKLDPVTFGIHPHLPARWLVSVVFIWSLLIVFALTAWLSRGAPAARGGGSPAAWTLLGLVLLNGLAPVIGYKNRNSWQMYSNVRIEADASNHWFLPPSLDLFGLEGDTVEIVSTDDRALMEEIVKKNLRMTWWDFRGWTADNPDRKVTYRRRGEVFVIDGPEDRPAPPPRLLRKFVWFRPVGEEVARQCVW